MTVDVGAFAARGRAVLGQAIATAGTTVTVQRDSNDQDTTVDLVTLEVTDPTEPAEIAVDVACLIRRAGVSTDPAGPERTISHTQFDVLFPVTFTAVAERDLLLITACPDPQLVGETVRVTSVSEDPIGVVRIAAAVRV